MKADEARDLSTIACSAEIEEVLFEIEEVAKKGGIGVSFCDRILKPGTINHLRSEGFTVAIRMEGAFKYTDVDWKTK